MFAKIAITPEAFYDEDGSYASVNTNCIHSFSANYSPWYVLAWVNSKLFQYVFECFFDGLKMQGGYLLYSAPNLNNMYIKRAPAKLQSSIEAVAREIAAAARDRPDESTATLLAKVDLLFYKLFDLSPEDVSKVERDLGRGFQHRP